MIIRPAILVTALLLTWSVLMFGGVYPWVFWPVGVGCVTVMALSWMQQPGPVTPTAVRVFLPWMLIALAVGLFQLIPLPTGLVETLSPRAAFFLRGDTGFHTGEWAHLSLMPGITAGSLAWTTCLAMLFLGLVRVGRTGDFRVLAGVATALGCLIALLGLGQEGNSLTYGFWQPRGVNAVFGPFVNRNHFAGWMVLAVASAAGLFCRSVERCPPASDGAWHGRLRALISPEGCQAMLLAGAMLMMVLAIAVSFSRSGLVAIVVVAILIPVFGVGRVRRLTGRRVAGGLVIASLSAIAALAAGPGAIATHFASAQLSLFPRFLVWREALGIVREFPLLGTGLGTFGLVFPHFRTNAPDGFLEAHNDYVQVLVEGGLLMALAIAALAGRFGWEALRRLRAARSDDDYWIRAGALAGVAGMAVQETVEFSLRSPAVAVLFAVCCATAVHDSDDRRS